MSYEDPRAYLLGIEGLALLRAFTGECDRAFVEARIAEIRRVLADDGTLARTRVPDGEFLNGDLHRLPVPDDGVDLVVCSLALTHVEALGPVMAEFARVLRPGGHLVISDLHHEAIAQGSIPSVRDAAGRPGRVSTYRHLVGDYLRAALPVGLQVRRCEEPRRPAGPSMAATDVPGPWDQWPWSLADMLPEAAEAAWGGTPGLVIWHFQLA